MDPPPWPQTAGARARAAGPSVRPSVTHAIWYVGHQDTAASAAAMVAQAGKAGQPRKEKEDETTTVWDEKGRRKDCMLQEVSIVSARGCVVIRSDISGRYAAKKFPHKSLKEIDTKLVSKEASDTQ